MGLIENINRDKRIKALSRLSVEDRDANRLPIVYGDNDFVLSREGAWAVHSLPTKPWGYLKDTDKLNYFLSGTSFFNRTFPAEAGNAGHLLVTNHTYSSEAWQDALLAHNEERALKGFELYLDETRRNIDVSEFFTRDIYLATRLGDRFDYSGVMGAARQIVDFFSNGFGLDDAQPLPDEIEHWRAQAEQLAQAYSGSWFRTEPQTRRRVEWLVRHLDTPAQPTPDVAPADRQEWGIGEWQTTLAAYTEVVDLGINGKEKYKCVQFETPTGTGTSYAAYLPLSHTPDEMDFGQKWMQHASTLPFPVDISVHFEVIDSERAQKDLDRPISAAENQASDDAEVGHRTDQRTLNQTEMLRQLKEELDSGRLPLMYWQAVFMVTDTSKEGLLKKVIALKRHYSDIDFELVVPVNDQRELFYQSFPGSDVIIKDWMQKSKTDFFVAGQPWVSTEVGDGKGLYQGYTVVADSQGVAQRGVPVFYDLQNIGDDNHQAPTEIVFGDPGSGKTVSRGLKCALEDGYKGITQFIWDPKGDFLPLKLYAKQMMLNPDKVRLIDLYDPEASISLDAFAIAEVDPENKIDDRASTAIEILEALCRRFLQGGDSVQYARILTRAVNVELSDEVTTGRAPTMRGVLARLDRWGTGDLRDLSNVQDEVRGSWINMAQALSEHLDTQSKDTLGRLLFAVPQIGQSMSVEAGSMTIFVALNLQPTEEGAEPTSRSTIHDVISGLMTDYIRSLLYRLPDEEPKVLVFDEWHVIKRTKRAEALVNWLRRMGRSKRAQVRQLSQAAVDFDTNSLSAVWAGKCQTRDSAIASCTMLEIEPSERNVSTLMRLGAGEFLFRDPLGRIARVYVDIWDQWLLDRFNTQPDAKARLLEEMRLTQPELLSTGAAA